MCCKCSRAVVKSRVRAVTRASSRRSDVCKVCTAACWANKGAFALYACAWFAAIMVFGTLTALIFELLGQAQLLTFVLAPMSLILSTVFYASLYFTFADSFSVDEPATLATPSQLI